MLYKSQYSTVEYSTVQYSIVHYCALLYTTALYIKHEFMTLEGAVWLNAPVQYYTIQYNVL